MGRRQRAEAARANGSLPRASDATGEATLELFRENDAYTEFIWRRLVALSACPPAGRILEIGAGIGNLTRIILRSERVTYLRALDMESAYIERIRNSIADARLEASVGRAEDFCPEELQSGDGQLDRIVASNVLEHIADDGRVLSNFRRMLRPDGLALILVPAHPVLYCSLDAGLAHVRRYRRRDLEAAASRASLVVIRMRHFNPLGVLGWWWSGKVLRRSILPARQLRLYSRFALPLSGLLDRWNPLPFGISIIAVLGRSRDGTPV